MDRSIAAVILAATAPVAAAQLAITPVDAFAQGGGRGSYDSADFSLSEFFANQDEMIATMPTVDHGTTTLNASAGTPTSGGILDLLGTASGFSEIDLAFPTGTASQPNAIADPDTAVITATASVSASFSIGSAGDFEGGFVTANGFANGAIAIDISETLFAFASGDFVSRGFMSEITRLDPGRHVFAFAVGTTVSASGPEVTDGLDISSTDTFNGQIVLSRVPAPAAAVVLLLPLAVRRRR